MKKTLAIIMTFAMLFSMVAVFTVSAEVKEVKLSSYSDGIENWGGETVVLIIADGEGFKDQGAMKYRWELTISDGTTSTTVTKVPSSWGGNMGATGGLYRFTTCIGAEGNQFVPEVDKEYTISAKIYSADGSELLYEGSTIEGESYKGFGPFLTDGAITHEPTEGLTIAPHFSHWENWTGGTNGNATQLLVKIEGEFGDPMLDDETYLWEVKISSGDETTTLVTKPATHWSNYSLYRFETCIGVEGNQFVPVAGASYTVQITVYDAEGNVVAAPAAVSGFNVPADLVPVVEEPLEGEKPVIPTPDTGTDPINPPVDPVDPPVEPDQPITGDATVYAIVFAVVALMGMGVVVTKKVRA